MNLSKIYKKEKYDNYLLNFAIKTQYKVLKPNLLMFLIDIKSRKYLIKYIF
jgi:hypothetical protein